MVWLVWHLSHFFESESGPSVSERIPQHSGKTCSNHDRKSPGLHKTDGFTTAGIYLPTKWKDESPSPSTLRNFGVVLDVGGVLPHRLVGGVDDGRRLRLRRHRRGRDDDVGVGVVADAVAAFVERLAAQPTQG